jgi:propanol-preferring alcohol dehydrogenase
MQAVRLAHGTLVIEDVPVRQPGPGDALIRIDAAGVCHSDLHVARGEWAGVRPELLGHEAIGTVVGLGSGADAFVVVGDRVVLGLGGGGGGYWCGACVHCLGGRPRLCTQAKPIVGTFAEYFTVWAKSLVTIPDRVGDEEASLACGGLTAYGAVKKLLAHHVVPGRPVAIVGAAGGLGHYAVQLANAFGYRVVGVEVGDERLEFVRSLGAELAVSADDAREVVAREVGGVDASLVFSSRMDGFRLGFDLLGPHGLFVAVGLPATSEGSFSFNPFELFRKDPTIIYSAVGTVQDMRELVDLAAAGKVRTHVSRTGALTDLPTIFDELAAASYLGRAVVTDLSH